VKTRISIQLSKAVLAKVDLLAEPTRSRSAAIERILSQFLLERKKDALHACDLQQINRKASRLNLEAAEVLEYQSIEENPGDIEDRHVAEARLKKRGRTYTTAQVRSKLGLDN
jgi:predicted transcriptional regulator